MRSVKTRGNLLKVLIIKSERIIAVGPRVKGVFARFTFIEGRVCDPATMSGQVTTLMASPESLHCQISRLTVSSYAHAALAMPSQV